MSDEPGRPAHRFREVVVLRLEFLDAHDVGILSAQPVEEAFVDRRADAIKIQCDDSKHRTMKEQSDFRGAFVEFAIAKGVLLFGEFKTKAGRLSPYFFNAGLFNDGESLRELGRFYALTLGAAGVEFDVLFGPAYKGIPLASATVVAMARTAATCRSPSTARKPRITARAAPSSVRSSPAAS
jgi:hypothetical protein